MNLDKDDFLSSDTQGSHHARRGLQDALLKRIHLFGHQLTKSEKALALLVLEHNNTFAAIARTSGVASSTICRRYYRIIAKLRSAPLPPETLDKVIARQYRCSRLSQIQIANKYNISRYRVRKALAKEGAGHD